MNKTLVFLYPINEYLRMLDLDNETYEKFVRTLDLRYRAKGCNIYFVIFPDKNIDLPFCSTDNVIFTDIKFTEHTTKNDNEEYPYPDPDFIIKQLPKSDEYIICGFHAADCVEKIASYFHNKGMNTLVDIHLTDLFYGSIQSPYFNEKEYNLATHIEWLKGREMAFSNKLSMGRMIESNYSKPFYKLKEFIPEITAEEVAIESLKKHLERKDEQANKRK